MAKVCRTIQKKIIKEIIEPLEKWINSQKKECKKRKWPLNWFCWLVTFLVKVIIWITKNIIIYTSIIICNFISFILLPIAILIDIIFTKCNLVEWLKNDKIEFINSTISSNVIGYYDYNFVCNCVKGNKIKVMVTAINIEEAFILAKKECENKC